jgi:putative transposase
MREWSAERAVAVWAYCLMPNHVHLIVVQESEDGLRRAIGEAHRRYTRMVNFREDGRGHLWQGRFALVVLHIFDRVLTGSLVRSSLCGVR